MSRRGDVSPAGAGGWCKRSSSVYTRVTDTEWTLLRSRTSWKEVGSSHHLRRAWSSVGTGTVERRVRTPTPERVPSVGTSATKGSGKLWPTGTSLDPLDTEGSTWTEPRADTKKRGETGEERTSGQGPLTDQPGETRTSHSGRRSRPVRSQWTELGVERAIGARLSEVRLLSSETGTKPSARPSDCGRINLHCLPAETRTTRV